MERREKADSLYFLVLWASSRVAGAWERVGMGWLGPGKPTIQDARFSEDSTVEQLLLV